MTFSAEGGAPAATSDRFPVGTRLRVTNLDNSQAATVTVTGPSGSCVLLNAAAMELVREPGKNVIRRNVVERLDGAAPPRRRGAPARCVPAAAPGAAGPAPSRLLRRDHVLRRGRRRRRRPAASSRWAPGCG